MEYKKFTKEELNEKIKPFIPKLPKETQKEAKLTLPNGQTINLPVYKGSEGPPMIDIQNLYQLTGMITFDPGFTATGSCASAITFIDGEKGMLRYRGYQIQDLAENCSYIEVCYLLIYGNLPDVKELERFEQLVINEMMIHSKLVQIYKGFEKDAHPMAILCGVVGSMSSYFQNTDITDPRERETVIIKLIAKIPTIAAYSFRTANGLPYLYPKKKYSYIENFMYMLFGNPMDDSIKIDPKIIRAMETIFIVHADHEQNASTSTVRIASSSFANPVACLSAGITALWGPAHGGANEACLKMLKDIGKVERIPEIIQKIKNKEFRLMGFGHRVYKNFDPRATVMKKVCAEVLEIVDKADSEVLKVADQLQKAALTDKYFTDRKLYPNVDYFTGIMYEALDIPVDMFTVMFAVARTVGWLVHWNEQMAEGLNKICRPRQLYLGEIDKKYVDIEDREVQKESKVPTLPKLCKFTNLVRI